MAAANQPACHPIADGWRRRPADADRAFATRLLAEVPALDLAVAAAKRLALCL